eukprot:311438_1
MSKAATHLWHKPSEHAAWTHRFVTVSDSIIYIYPNRQEYKSGAQKNAIHLILLSNNTKLIDGNDIIMHQGWLVKKGKFKWNARWCALTNYGYLKYVDIKQTSDIRQIDFSKAKFSLQKYHNLIYWMYHGDRVYFRCDSPSIQKKWYQKMTSIQHNCYNIRTAYKKRKLLHKEPTLFAFTVINKTEKHYFCAMNDQYLAAWKKCITEQSYKLSQKENINNDVDMDNDQQNIYIMRGAQVTYIRDSKVKISIHDEKKSNSNDITPETIDVAEDTLSRVVIEENVTVKENVIDIVKMN